MVPWAAILAAVAIVLAFYYYFMGHTRCFEKSGIPHLKPKFLFGSMADVVFKRRSMTDQVKWIYDRIPEAKYIGFHDFTLPTIMLRDPEVIKHVTVKYFDHFVNHTMVVNEDVDPFFGKNLFGLQDDAWREMRSILSPSFTSSKMKAMFQLVSKCGAKFADNLASGQRDIDLKDNFSRYAMDVIATAAFGISVDSIKDPDNEFYVMGKEATTFDSVRTMKLFFLKLAPFVTKILRVSIISDRVARFFSHIVSSTVKARENKGQTRNDMIQLMIEARNSGKAPNLSVQDMTAQAFIFFFGGFDTTATAMSFAAYEIATNQRIQETLQAEIDNVLSDCNGELTWESFQKMHYLEAVVNEALRKWPPANFTDRVCNKPVEIPPALPGGRPFTIQKGTVIWLPYFGLHRDPRYFKDPETFDPERFIDPVTGKNREPYGFLPFGSGPRFCIGQRFAMMETKLAIFHLMAKCRLRPCSRTRVPVTLNKKSFTMTPEHGFWVEISPRK